VLVSLRAGMYELSGHTGSTLERVTADPVEAADSGIEAGRWKIPGQPPASLPETPLGRFSNGLDLLEGRASGAAGNQALVDLRWQARVAPSQDITVFVQALSSDGQLLGQHDSYPLDGRYPTTLWSAGEQVFDRVQLQLSRPLEPRDRVVVGLYVLPHPDERVPTLAGDSVVTVPA